MAKKKVTPTKKRPRRTRRRYVPADPEILNAEAAAKAIGVTKLLLLRMARDGEVPGRKVGKEWRFHRTTLRRWIAGESETGAMMEAIKQQGLKVTRTRKKR